MRIAISTATSTALLLLWPLVSAHARIKYPVPLAAPPETPAGNAYNAPLTKDGSQFPCKGLHKSVNFTGEAKTKWKAGETTYFEILGHVTPGTEGPLAAHSGGSCQASMSFDGGETWKVLHSFEGGCPRGVEKGTNIAKDPNQKFEFRIPANTRSGPALFAWTWIAVGGNRDEFYMNCATVEIEGSGTDRLQGLPDMYLGEMQIQGHIATGECASTPGTALEYPNPGENVTKDLVQGISLKRPTEGKCFAPGSGGAHGNGKGGKPTSTLITSTTTPAASGADTGKPSVTATTRPSGDVMLPSIRLDVDDEAGTCNCTCQL